MASRRELSGQKLAIIGAGGHARVVADAAELAGFAPGFVTAEKSESTELHGYPLLGTDDDVKDLALDHVFVLAVGDNAARKQVAERMATVTFVSVIHPSAVVARDARLEPGVVVLANAVVNPGARIGAHSIINTGAIVEHDCNIADFVHVAPGSAMGGWVSVAEGTLIGLGARLLPRVAVGAWSVVGGGGVVTKDVADGVVVYGVPSH